MEESLRYMLKHGRKFERLTPDEPGLFVKKIPRSKDDPAYLAVEINPIGQDGKPMNRMGIIIRSQTELDAIRALLVQERVDEMLQTIEKVSQNQIDEMG
jgi:hypothetical protein